MMAMLARGAIIAIAATLIATLPMLHLTRVDAGAQAAAAILEIVHVEHSARGSLDLGVRVDGGRETKVQSLTVFVDDVPVALDLAKRVEQRPIALVVLVDTSGSMAGTPIEAAREAARGLLDRLPKADRAGLIAFAGSPAVLAPLTQDRQAVAGRLGGLHADGATALYEAVGLGATQLSAVADARRVIVLLSDGRDSGQSPSARTESIRRVKELGISVYAVGLGDDFDEAYLLELAADHDGGMVTVGGDTDVSALIAVLARLGGTLGANERYSIPIASLAQGKHRLRVRGLINGAVASADATFEVTNAGLLRAAVIPGSVAGAAIQVRLGESVRGQDLTVEARVGSQTFVRPGDASTIDIDPWRLTPGAHDVEVVALARGVVAAAERVQIEVPALSPTIDLSERDGSYVARGRLQAASPPALVVRRQGVEAIKAAGDQVFPASGDRVVIELLDASGAVVLTREVAARSVANASAMEVAGGVGAATALAAAAVWWFTRRRRSRSEEPVLIHRALRQALTAVDPKPSPNATEAPVAASRPADAPIGMLVVRGGPSDGQEVPLTRRPITVGSASACDIVIDEREIRPRHATITALPSGEVQVHGIALRGARPYLGAEEDEWVVMRGGEQIVFGDISLQLVMPLSPPLDHVTQPLGPRTEA